MRQAIEAVRTREMGYQKVSAQFAVPKSTLERRVKNINKRALGTLKILGSKQPVFNSAMETELSSYIQRMEERLFGLTTDDTKGLAFQLASRNGIPNPFRVNSPHERRGQLLLHEPGALTRHVNFLVAQWRSENMWLFPVALMVAAPKALIRVSRRCQICLF